MSILLTSAVSSETDKVIKDAKKENGEIKLELIEPFKIKSDRIAKARFSNLSEAAKKKKMDAIILQGVVKISPDVNSYRVDISWNKLFKNEEDKVGKLITPALKSNLKAVGNLPADKPFKAVGDIEKLANLSQDQGTKPVTPGSTNPGDKNVAKNNKNTSNSGSPGGAGSSGGATPTGGNTSETVPELEDQISYSYEACDDRIDLENGIAYSQEREVQTNSEGQIISRGDCIDTGLSTTFQTTGVLACVDRVDQEAGLLYKQEQAVRYDQNGDIISYDECKDTGETSTFANFTIEACEPTFDDVTSMIIVNHKVIPTDPDGNILSDTDCTDSGERLEPIRDVVACDPRRNGEIVHLQDQTFFLNPDNNQTMGSSECSDNGETVPVQRDYAHSCSPSVNIEDRVAYRRYNEFAIVNGKQWDYNSCTFDIDQPLVLTSTYEGCEVRDEFVQGYSVQQERFFYEMDASRTFVTDCLDSPVTYTHFETEVGCTPLTDDLNGTVTIFSQVAYNIGSQVYYPASCRPSSKGTTNLVEEVCDPEWSHNFSSNQSSRLTRFYYYNLSNQKVYHSSCDVSTDTFAHIEETGNCPIVYDLEDHLGYQHSETVFYDENNNREVIRECGQHLPGVPYQRSLSKTASNSYSVARSTRWHKVIRFSSEEMAPYSPQNVSFNVSGSFTCDHYCYIAYSVSDGSINSIHSWYHEPSGSGTNRFNQDVNISLSEGQYVDFYVRGTCGRKCIPVLLNLTVDADWP
jgi:hypothetical protein